MARSFGIRAIVCLALFIQSIGSRKARADESLPPTLDATVSRGLDFLASQQGVEGSFGTVQKPAMTGMALMSFLASGHTPSALKTDPNLGKYGLNVRSAIDYLMAEAQPDGSFGHNDKPMYGQAIATLALAEAFGVDDNESQRKQIALVLNKSVKMILAAQDVKKPDLYIGGWRYDYNAPDSDLSLSGWNVLALRACKDVGINVPKPAIEHAVKFVLKCYSPDAKGFAYQPGGAVSPGTTGIGILCLHLLDGGARPEAEAAARSLAQKPVDDSAAYPYYGMYYATQAAFQAGDSIWPQVSKITFDKLIKLQQPDGGWADSAESGGTGRIYATSLSLLTLSIPYRLLPVYQR